MITTTMFDRYNPGELIGPAIDSAPKYFRRGDFVRVVHGAYSGHTGHIVHEGRGPYPQGPLDYEWYEVVLTTGTKLYVAGWGWLLPAVR